SVIEQDAAWTLSWRISEFARSPGPRSRREFVACRWLGGKAIAKSTFNWILPLQSISSPPKIRPSTGTSTWSNNSRD
ncbi:unnamed protein product, partial [Linum tenue]